MAAASLLPRRALWEPSRPAEEEEAEEAEEENEVIVAEAEEEPTTPLALDGREEPDPRRLVPPLGTTLAWRALSIGSWWRRCVAGPASGIRDG
jgi:hypothetical protein